MMPQRMLCIFQLKQVLLCGLLVTALAGGCAKTDPSGAQAFIEWVSERVISVESLDSSFSGADLESIREAIAEACALIRHFHISEEHLARIGSGTVPQGQFAAALNHIHYDRWVAIEMRSVASRSNVDRVADAIAYSQSAYFEN